MCSTWKDSLLSAFASLFLWNFLVLIAEEFIGLPVAQTDKAFSYRTSQERTFSGQGGNEPQVKCWETQTLKNLSTNQCLSGTHKPNSVRLPDCGTINISCWCDGIGYMWGKPLGSCPSWLRHMSCYSPLETKTTYTLLYTVLLVRTYYELDSYHILGAVNPFDVRNTNKTMG